MIRKYLESFIVVKYYPFVTVCPLLLFPVLVLYMKEPTGIRRVLLAAAGLLCAAVIVKYRYDKYRLGKQLKQLGDLSVWNDGILLGRCVLTENRWLCYDNNRLAVQEYPEIREAALRREKSHIYLDLSTDEGIRTAETGSEAQAQRTCAFLQKKNAEIRLTGIQPAGNGDLRAIYRAS
ncbi:MAG: hypothetical protein IJJ24_09135 [Solobacterium sp.]|nr:hypothetical protein [Solobacterium sp.]MBR0479240.1 hypothetical protein [Solobacterium sp.]